MSNMAMTWIELIRKNQATWEEAQESYLLTNMEMSEFKAWLKQRAGIK